MTTREDVAAWKKLADKYSDEHYRHEVAQALGAACAALDIAEHNMQVLTDDRNAWEARVKELEDAASSAITTMDYAISAHAEAEERADLADKMVFAISADLTRADARTAVLREALSYYAEFINSMSCTTAREALAETDPRAEALLRELEAARAICEHAARMEEGWGFAPLIHTWRRARGEKG